MEAPEQQRYNEPNDISFSDRERRDLAAAWAALSLAFAFFFDKTQLIGSQPFITIFSWTAITVGAGFLLHELGHKVIAIRYGQEAEFRANYQMLALAIVGGLIGFIFAAPGAVYHRGWLTVREEGLIAAAGPVTNLLLAVFFVPVFYILPEVSLLGIGTNLLLAGFNMIPFGPLDGKTVLQWNSAVFFVLFTVALTAAFGGFFILI